MACPEEMIEYFAEEWLDRGEPQYYAPDGWTDIILQCHHRLKAINPSYEIHQIKEKFGGLRYYIDCNVEAGDSDTIKKMNDVITDAEKQCASLCETCGAPDAQLYVVNKRYLTTRCEAHAEGIPYVDIR